MDWSKLLRVLNGFTLQQKVSLLGLGLALLTAIVVITSFVLRPNFALLYADLDAASAGQMMAQLDQRGVSYQVRGSGIFVEKGLRDTLRMNLAAEGLPRNPTRGYEILEDLPQFGTTSQMFGAAMLRAREGELAKSIASMPNVAWARVHLTGLSAQPGRKDTEQKASVSVQTRGGGIQIADAVAIRHLVAASVPKLDIKNVVVIADGTHVTASLGGDGSFLGDQKIEDGFRARITRLLEAHVGSGNAIVEVRVETSKSSEQIVERIVDPETRIIVSTSVQEIQEKSSSSQNGDVTVASDLPQVDQNGQSGDQNNKTETRETTNYDFTEIHREVQKAAGEIEKITVAALINSAVFVSSEADTEVDGSILKFEELVKSVIGFKGDRGDLVTIKTLEFAGASIPTEKFSLIDKLLFQIPIFRIIEVFLAVGVFVIIVSLLKKNFSKAIENIELIPQAASQNISNTQGEIFTDGPQESKGTLVLNHEKESNQPVTPADRMKALIQERRHETLEVLKLWLDENKRTT